MDEKYGRQKFLFPNLFANILEFSSPINNFTLPQPIITKKYLTEITKTKSFQRKHEFSKIGMNINNKDLSKNFFEGINWKKINLHNKYKNKGLIKSNFESYFTSIFSLPPFLKHSFEIFKMNLVFTGIWPSLSRP